MTILFTRVLHPFFYPIPIPLFCWVRCVCGNRIFILGFTLGNYQMAVQWHFHGKNKGEPENPYHDK